MKSNTATAIPIIGVLVAFLAGWFGVDGVRSRLTKPSPDLQITNPACLPGYEPPMRTSIWLNVQKPREETIIVFMTNRAYPGLRLIVELPDGLKVTNLITPTNRITP